MKPWAITRRIQLQVKSSSFDGLLFLASQLSEAIGKGVKDAEFHDLNMVYLGL